MFGTVLAVDEDWFVLSLLHLSGRDDGCLLLRTNRIHRVETDGRYSRKMQRLAERFTHSVISFHNNGSVFESILRSVDQKDVLVSVELLGNGDVELKGFLKVSKKIVELSQIDEYGESDGISYFCWKISVKFLSME